MVNLHLDFKDRIKVFWGKRDRYIVKLGSHKVYLNRKQLEILKGKIEERLKS